MIQVMQKNEVAMKMSATCPTHARSDISARDLEGVIDEPVDRGGDNLGFTPTETLVAALIGCTNVITNRISEGYGIHIDAMEINAEARFDRRGVMMKEEVKVPFPEITLDIAVTTPHEEAEFARVKEDLRKFCPISKVIRESGTTINENWSFSKAS